MIFQGWFSHVTRFLRWTPKNISQNGFIFPKKCLKPQPSQQFTPENRPVGPPKGNKKVVNPCIYPKKKQWKIVKSSRKSSRIFPSNQNGMGWSSLLLYWLTGVWVHRFFECDGCHGHPKWQKMKETSFLLRIQILVDGCPPDIPSQGTFEDHFPFSQGGIY